MLLEDHSKVLLLPKHTRNPSLITLASYQHQSQLEFLAQLWFLQWKPGVMIFE